MRKGLAKREHGPQRQLTQGRAEGRKNRVPSVSLGWGPELFKFPGDVEAGGPQSTRW